MSWSTIALWTTGKAIFRVALRGGQELILAGAQYPFGHHDTISRPFLLDELQIFNFETLLDNLSPLMMMMRPYDRADKWRNLVRYSRICSEMK
jgi:hypothetical protein